MSGEEERRDVTIGVPAASAGADPVGEEEEKPQDDDEENDDAGSE